MFFGAQASFDAGVMVSLAGIYNILQVLLLTTTQPTTIKKRTTTTINNKNSTTNRFSCSSSQTMILMNHGQRNSVLAFAFIPLLFGCLQLVEGCIWFNEENIIAIRIFAYIAMTVIPIYISFTMTWIEFERRPSNSSFVSSSSSSSVVHQNDDNDDDDADDDLSSSSSSSSSSSIEQQPHQAPKLLFPEEQLFMDLSIWLRKNITGETRKVYLCTNIMLSILCYFTFTYCLWAVEPLSVTTLHGQMEYATCQKYIQHVPLWQSQVGRFLYTYIIVSSLFLSSMNYNLLLSILAGISAIISSLFWNDQFESTWCYFMSIISIFTIFMVRYEIKRYSTTTTNKNNGLNHETTYMQIKKTRSISV